MPVPIRAVYLQRSSLKEWFTLLLDLTKVRISLLVTLSVAAGYILNAGQIKMETLVAGAAVFFLSCGSCGLNQYQERKIDRLMERTKGRPLPSGTLNPGASLLISLGLIFTGSSILFYGIGGFALALGLFALLWYNGVYTYLKQRTAFASVPGALVGAIPPVLGWVSGGGSVFDLRIWGVALFFFIWQVPHFWLLLLTHSEEYEKAGIPCITQLFSTKQIQRILFIWLLSTGVSGLSIPSFGFLNSNLIYLSLLGATIWLIWSAIHFLRSYSQGTTVKITFTKLNIYALVVLFLLSMDRLLGR